MGEPIREVGAGEEKPMKTHMQYTLDGMETEFRGKSWNGLSLLATFDKLTASEAADTRTWEGYSAWEIALHCAKCKRIVAHDLAAQVPPWPFSEGWFPSPAVVSEEAWARDRALLVACHEAMMEALRAFPESRLGDEMPTWKSSWGTVLAWFASHDSFHGAQVRSMGLPSLKAKKHE